ncbi:hypothetical protein K435DRAFT_801427 [Dendrothele bispora CBS 962.96]|uniref:G domain-containing protein n=1 Tax=Dendrothele bispora (strain CBS 962.96) TaxID=1314807 RepID=A0A4S8LPB8_DENBC|nr:hypothetical protein K435DRAFT_801427 [Dendrothele bispora CBS 962.96]
MGIEVMLDGMYGEGMLDGEKDGRIDIDIEEEQKAEHLFPFHVSEIHVVILRNEFGDDFAALRCDVFALLRAQEHSPVSLLLPHARPLRHYYKLTPGQLRTARHLIDQIVKDYISRLPANVGKSSFINEVTRADVDVGPYAFTTKSLFAGEVPEMTDAEHNRVGVFEELRVVLYGFESNSNIQSNPFFSGKPTILLLNKSDIKILYSLPTSTQALVNKITDPSSSSNSDSLLLPSSYARATAKKASPLYSKDAKATLSSTEYTFAMPKKRKNDVVRDTFIPEMVREENTEKMYDKEEFR